MKEHFKNLFGNSFKITDKPIKKIIYSKLDIKLGQFMEEELDIALKKKKKKKKKKKIKKTKPAGLDKIPPEI